MRVGEADQVTGGEDFSPYGIAGFPCFMYRIGTIEAGRFGAMQRRGQTISLNAPDYYPDIDMTLLTAILTMAAGTLEILRQSETASCWGGWARVANRGEAKD